MAITGLPPPQACWSLPALLHDIRVIRLNKVRCKTCFKKITSHNEISWVSCACGKVSIRGGRIRCERNVINPETDFYEELTQVGALHGIDPAPSFADDTNATKEMWVAHIMGCSSIAYAVTTGYTADTLPTTFVTFPL